MSQQELCALINKLRTECSCLPPIWTDCGCSIEIDHQRTTYSSAGLVSDFISAVELSATGGFNANTGPVRPMMTTVQGTPPDGFDVFGSTPIAQWLASGRDAFPDEPGHLKSASFAALEITLDRRLADVTEAWFLLSIGGAAMIEGDDIGGFPFLIQPGLTEVNVYDESVLSSRIYSAGKLIVGATHQIAFKIDTSVSRRVYIPVLRSDPFFLEDGTSPIRIAAPGEQSALTNKRELAGIPCVVTSTSVDTQTNYLEDGIYSPGQLTSNFPVIMLGQIGAGGRPAKATLRLVSQKDPALLRTLSALSSAISH